MRLVLIYLYFVYFKSTPKICEYCLNTFAETIHYLPIVSVFTKLHKFPRPIHNYIIHLISERNQRPKTPFKAFSCCLPSTPPTNSHNQIKKKYRESSKIQNLNCQCRLGRPKCSNIWPGKVCF